MSQMPLSDSHSAAVTPPCYTPKQAAILQGAMTVFLASGYAHTSMDRVAAAAGVS